MEKLISGILMTCYIVLGLIMLLTIGSVTAGKTYGVSIIDMIAVIIAMLQNPIVWIIIVAIIICTLISSNIEK